MISKEMTIGEVVQNYPETVEIMLKYGLHCIGCGVSPFESIEGGAAGHGMSEIEVTEMLKEMNQVVASKPKVEKDAEPATGIILTEKCVSQLKKLMDSENKVGFGLRFIVRKGGCAGMTYEMEFAEKPEKDEKEFESNGMKVFMSEDAVKYFAGSTIDFKESLKGGGFSLKNPNAKASCGCGSSYSV